MTILLIPIGGICPKPNTVCHQTVEIATIKQDFTEGAQNKSIMLNDTTHTTGIHWERSPLGIEWRFVDEKKNR